MKLLVSKLSILHWIIHISLASKTLRTMDRILPNAQHLSSRHRRSIDRLTNHDLIGSRSANEDSALMDKLSKDQRKNLRDLLMANDPSFLSKNQRSIISKESQHYFDDLPENQDNQRFRRTNSRQRGSNSRSTSERDRRREIRRTSRERVDFLSSLPEENNNIETEDSPSNEQTILNRLSTRHHHTTSQRKQFVKIYKQLNATNSSNPEYATVYTPPDSLPRYECPVGKWACATPKRSVVSCIDEAQVCDYHVDCPKGDDEDPTQCSFYRQTRQLILRQQQEIVSLQTSLSRHNDTYKCKIAELNNKILHHAHNQSIVNLNHDRPAYSCHADLR